MQYVPGRYIGSMAIDGVFLLQYFHVLMMRLPSIHRCSMGTRRLSGVGRRRVVNTYFRSERFILLASKEVGVGGTIFFCSVEASHLCVQVLFHSVSLQ